MDSKEALRMGLEMTLGGVGSFDLDEGDCDLAAGGVADNDGAGEE